MENNYRNGNDRYSPAMYRDLMFDPTAGTGVTDHEAEVMLFDAIPLDVSDLEIVAEEAEMSAEARSAPQVKYA